ncbi:tetratricopeptide repeat protein [Aestuariivivens sediminis]|uniref:tetratricopeptide repeat-containing sensor histidine kinase n=1 Tax=Aestuariivivens sediminis TaxID=2913557 RepID=UPI001F59CA6C|nr:tetratricopeptide repeat protein [Aestuariivivens sediminis]
MEKSSLSFLFLCVLCVNGVAVNHHKLLSQSVNDSTLMYYTAITELKEGSQTIEAFDFFEKRSQQALHDKDSIMAAYYLELLSLGQFKMGFYYESEATAIKAIELLNQSDSLEDKEPFKRLNNHLGMLYRKLEDYDNAFLFYGRALALQNDSSRDLIAITTNLVNLYADQERYEKAVQKLKPYYSTALSLDNSNIKANYFDNLGYYQSKIGDSEGLHNMQLALDLRKQLKDITGLFSSYRHLSLYHLSEDNKALALKYTTLAKGISNDMNSPSYQLEALELEFLIDSKPELKKYIELNRRIQKEERLQENKFAAVKYSINESERKLKESQLQTARQKQLTLIYFFSGLFFLLLIGFLYFYLKAKHKKDRLLVAYNTEAQISKKVHDEVANDVYRVMSKYQEGSNAKEHFLDDLELIYNKTRDISKESEAINFDEDFGSVLSDLFENYDNNTLRIITKNLKTISWSTFPNIEKTPIYRALQELLTNTRKHSNASFVVIEFQKTPKGLEIKYRDNGTGCELRMSNGLKNTENRIQAINGTITFDSKPGNGFKAKIII